LFGQAPGTLDELLRQGAAAFGRNDCAEATRQYTAAAERARQESKPGALALADRRIGICGYRTGDNAGSLTAYREGIEAAKTAGDRDLLAENTHGAALALRHLGQFREALELSEREYALAQADGRPTPMIHAMTLLADIYGLTGRTRDAVALLERALAIAKGAGDRASETFILGNLVFLSHDFDDLEMTRHYIRESLARVDPKNRTGAAQVYNNAGIALRLAGQYEEAREYYRQALQYATTPLEWRQRTAALLNLSMTDQILGKLDEARTAIEEGLTIARESKNEEMESRLENERGAVLEKMGRPEEALRSAERALELGRKIPAPDRVSDALLTLARVREDAGLIAEARLAYREALDLIESMRAQAPDDPELMRVNLAATLPPYQEAARFEAQRGDVHEAFRLAEQAKARVLTAVLSSGGLREQKVMTPEEREEERRLRGALEAANTRLSAGHTAESRERALDAAERLEAFRAGFRGSHPERETTRATFTMASWQEIAAVLPPGGAAIEYFQTTASVAVFVVRRDRDGGLSIRVAELPQSMDRLRAEITAFREQLAQRDLTYQKAARRLYELVVKPAAPFLTGATALIVSPDGPLWELPFGALIDERGRHLIESRPISLAPSLTALARIRSRRGNGGPPPTAFLGIAGAPLPDAVQEVETIAALYGKTAQVFTGSKATAAVFRERAPKAAVIHVAAHAELNNVAPLYSFLALDRETVSAHDLLETPLRARVFVLSACETAGGKSARGEGLVGLGWAATAAGASASIVSQWKVDSTSTASLMVGLHRHLTTNGRGAAAALREAVLEARKLPARQHPFYWAAFTLLGDGY
jgi:CHAT domain-containing protein/Tfp pilus assembly protein PilF